jgi:acyl carrier protein
LTVFEKLSDLLVDQFGISRERINPEATIESLELDSLEIVDLVGILEDEFRVNIDGDGFGELSCVSDIVKLIEQAD